MRSAATINACWCRLRISCRVVVRQQTAKQCATPRSYLFLCPTHQSARVFPASTGTLPVMMGAYWDLLWITIRLLGTILLWEREITLQLDAGVLNSGRLHLSPFYLTLTSSDRPKWPIPLQREVVSAMLRNTPFLVLVTPKYFAQISFALVVLCTLIPNYIWLCVARCSSHHRFANLDFYFNVKTWCAPSAPRWCLVYVLGNPEWEQNAD